MIKHLLTIHSFLPFYQILKTSPFLSLCFQYILLKQQSLDMGNKSSETSKQFQFQINHPRLTKSKILSREGQKELQTSQSVDEKEYDRWKKNLEKYHNANTTNLLLPKSHDFSRAGLCGNTGILQITYENYPYLLIEEIHNRKGLKGKFAETEIWFLLFSLAEARRQATAVGEWLGDVRPDNIFLNEAGNIKVTNSLSWPLEVNNLQKTYDKTVTYLAPQDFAKIGNGETFNTPTDASEAFSIGLSILSAGNLTKYDSLYDLNANELNLSALNEALSLWAHNSTYSEVLRGVVLLLLSVNPEKRLKCSQLQQLLGKHAQPIVKKENFVVDNAPAKLHEEIMTLRTILQQSILVHGATSPLISSQLQLEIKKGSQ